MTPRRAPSTVSLEGLVVAVEQAVAAPFASRQLADLGARVIKIERPGVGDFARGYDRTVKGLASHFVWINRSKESLTLDLKRPEAADVLRRLLSRADVFAPQPGARRDGAPRLRSAALRRAVSAFGRVRDLRLRPDGPYRDKKAYDLLVQSEAGLVSITGTPDDAVEGRHLDRRHRGRHVYAFSSILAALLRRERTGTGAVLDISMFDALAEWMGYPAYYTGYGGVPLPRSGRRSCGDRAVRAVHGRRWQGRVPRPAERARVGQVLRRCARAAGACRRSAVQRERRSCRASRRARCADHLGVRPQSSAPTSSSGSMPRRLPTRA